MLLFVEKLLSFKKSMRPGAKRSSKEPSRDALGRTSIKACTRDKRVGKIRPIRKRLSGPEVALSQVREQFIAMDEKLTWHISCPKL